MKSRILVIMALILAVATVASAATAFAEPKKEQQVSKQVADQVHSASQAILRLKVRSAKPGGGNFQPPVTFAAPSPNN